MRITGGALRSRILACPKGNATRPTADRVREALFSILGPVGDWRVLDVFAGTGALGLEALSRGAEEAVFIESARPALVCLRKNIDALGVGDRAKVIPKRVASALGDLKGEFDLVLCDPPWADVPDIADTLHSLGRLLARDASAVEKGVLVLEHAKRTEAPAIEGLEKSDSRVYGDAQLTFYKP